MAQDTEIWCENLYADNIYAKFSSYIDVKAWQAKLDGVSDDTIPLANALAAANQAGGGVVTGFNGKICISGNQTLYPNVIIDLQGGTIKLKNGANTDLFSAQTNLIDLTTAISTGPTGTLHNFTICNGILDGNKANQSSGPSYPLRFYGYSYKLINLEVKNGYSGNIFSDWNGTGSPVDSMEAQWVNIKTHDSNGNGITFGGPHDSQIVNIVPFKEGSHCIYVGAHAASSQFTTAHPYGSGQIQPTQFGLDSFTRANQSGWGTSDNGDLWANNSGGTPVTAAIASNVGTLTGGSRSYLISGSEIETQVDMKVKVNAGGDNLNDIGIVFGYTDINNNYRAYVEGANLLLDKVIAGVPTNLATVASGIANNVDAYIRVQWYGGKLRVKVWAATALEPNDNLWTASASDTQYSTGKAGVMVRMNSGTVNVYSYVCKDAIPPSVPIFIEADSTRWFNCVADSPPGGVAGVVVLGTGFIWHGGTILGNSPAAHSPGIQIGQLVNRPPFQSTNIYQSGGLTTAAGVTRSFLITRISQCDGDFGCLYLLNDSGHNKFDLIADTSSGGIASTGTLGATSDMEIITFGGLAGTDVHKINSALQIAVASTIYSCTGVPSNSIGANGDFYFRTDTPGSANQRLYVKSAGAWVGIL